MGDILNKALMFACEKHSKQLRKIDNVPYIVHPMEVASIISTITNDEEVISSGLLHDTIEDCDVDPLELKKLFGEKIFKLVFAESEDKLADRPPEETWMQRKEESLLILKNTKDLNVKILWLADKLANIRSFYRNFLKEGDILWENFHQKDKKKHEWYYRSVLEYTKDLEDTFAYQEYSFIVNELFKPEN